MAQYIDKSAFVAEIDKRIKTLLKNPHENHKTICHLDSLKQNLNTLEVKEVDLEKEIDKWWCSQFTDYSMKRVPNHKFIPTPAYTDSNFKQSETGKIKIAYELCIDWKVDSNEIEWSSETIREFAKHFFELGLKAQKGI